MIIDFHTHYFPDTIAAEAISSLEKKCGIKACSKGTRDSLLESMKEAGIDFSLNLPVATNPDKVEKINEISAKNNHAPIFCGAAMHPRVREPGKILARAKELGFKGIKLHPEYQDFDILSSESLEICRICEELDIFIVFHAGKDIAFKPPFHSDPVKFAELHSKFPRLKLALAHLGSWQMWNEVLQTLIGLPIYFDTSLTSDFIDRSIFEEIISKHPADRIIFGTDFPWQSQKSGIESIMNLNISAEKKEMIFWKNAAHLLQIL